MSRLDKWVAGVLTAGIVAILLGILMTAVFTRIPVAHIYVNEAGARSIVVEGHQAVAAPDWPGTYLVTPRFADTAFWPNATLDFQNGAPVTLPRRDIVLWVYRG